MVYYHSNNRLFQDHDLGAVLRHQIDTLNEEISTLSLEELTRTDDTELIKRFISKYEIVVPVVSEGEIDIDAKEASVEVYSAFGSRDDGTVSVPGLSIDVTLPFKGDKDLFSMRPSTWSLSGTPSGLIEMDRLVLHYETAEKDPERIKSLWKDDISTITKHLEWVMADASKYNDSLETSIQNALSNRRKMADDSKTLIDQLKG